ncbi:MAG: M23 family metallopeptidase [Deltaproteobacteria bacterium]|nr:M23 family metallopeptidase [Deltaproteobacteria bacterium]
MVVTLDRGRSFERSLTDHGVGAKDAAQLARVARRIGARESLRRGAVYEMELTANGRLLSFTHHTYPGIIYRVVRRGQKLKAETTRVEPRHRVVRISGSIGGSFVSSLERLGGDPALAFMISELFSRDADLLKKATRGDRIDLLVERIEAGPDLLGYGHVLAARYERTDGRTLFAFHHITEDGSEGYFDELGRPLAGHRFQVPVAKAHVTSVFGSRLHPILRRPRPHWGIDFAAATGTPIHAVAAGVVEYAQWHRQLGRVVVIRHANGVETKYAHMSYFAPGIRKGKRIGRGTRIGGVGATGLATGAHLHLEAKINGRLIDPATLILPEPPSLSDTELSMLRGRVLDTWEELESARFQSSGGSLIGDGNTLDLNLPNLAIVDPEQLLLVDDGVRS